MISETKAFVFIRVPKCAGTSTHNSLSQHDTRNNYYWMHHDLPGASESSPTLPIDKAHIPLAILKHLYPNDFRLLSSFTTFATSRHPLKRLISALLRLENNYLSWPQPKAKKR